jgi:hypothetical protein
MRPKRPRRRYRRVLVIALALGFLLLLLGGVVWFNLSAQQLKRRVVAILRDALEPDCTFTVGGVRFSFSEGFVVSDLTLCAPSSYHGAECVTVRRIRAVPKLGSVLTGRLVFRTVEVAGCDMIIEYGRPAGCNLARLLRPVDRTPTLPDRIQLRDCSVAFCPACLARLVDVEESELPARLLEGDFAGSVSAAGDHIAFGGTVTHALLNEVAVEGSLAQAQERLELELKASRVNVGEEAFRLLPQAARRELRALDPSCVVSASVSTVFETGKKPAVSVEGTIHSGLVKVPRLPYRLRHLKGRFSFDGSRLAVQEVRGSLAEGHVTGGGMLELTADGAVRSWQASVNVDRLSVDERFPQHLPADARTTWEHLNPVGEIGVALEFASSGGVLTTQGKILLKGVTAAWHEFPYPLRRLRGTIVVGETALDIPSPLTGATGSTAISIAGRCGLSLAEGVDLRIGLKGLPLDRDLRSCLPPPTREVWDAFRVGGHADVSVEVKREPGSRKARATATLAAKDCRISYRHFPYEVTKITGTMTVAKGEVTVSELAGYHEEAYITCRTGYWRETSDGPRYAFVFACPRLPVDEDLGRALRPEHRQILSDFQFEGSVAAAVKLFQTDTAPEGRLEIEADVEEGSRLKHFQFPLPLALAGGRIFIAPGFIRIEDLKTAEPEFSICCNRGVIIEDEQRRHYDLDLSFTRLRPEPALIEALPDHVSRFLQNLAVRGEFDAPNIAVQYAHDKQDPERFDLTYNAHLATKDAAMNLGLKFRHIQGRADIMGKATHEYPHKATGKLTLESLRFSRLRLTDIVLKCTYGRRHALLDELDGGGRPDTLEGEIQNRDAFLARYPGDASARDAFQVWLEKAKAYEGDVDGFLAVDVGERRDIMATVTASGVNLKPASTDIFRKGQASGLGKAQVYFHGDMNNLTTLEGNGHVMLREANLVKLPMFVSMFSLLRLQPVTTSYFSRVETKFRFDKGRFRAPRRDSITMVSEFMTLEGGGSVDFDLNLDLYLRLPSLGLPSIPVVSDALRLLLDNIMVFHVTGEVDDPSVKIVPIKDVLSLFEGSDEEP